MNITLEWPDEIQPPQLDEDFLQGMLDRMAVSTFKYGKVTVDAIRKRDMWETIVLRWNTYVETQNPEYLMDVANFAMIEYMVALLEGKQMRPTEGDESPGVVTFDGRITQDHERDLPAPVASTDR